MNVNARAVKFEPDDCILVEVVEPVTEKQRASIKEAVRKWSGGKNEILVLSLAEMRIKRLAKKSL